MTQLTLKRTAPTEVLLTTPSSQPFPAPVGRMPLKLERHGQEEDRVDRHVTGSKRAIIPVTITPSLEAPGEE